YMRNQLLRDTDWASMAHSMEVRVPLVDATLLETMVPFLIWRSDCVTKASLARSPLTPLPAKVTTRRKTGFMTPLVNWLEADVDFKQYATIPSLAVPKCHWSRRWAYGVVTN